MEKPVIKYPRSAGEVKYFSPLYGAICFEVGDPLQTLCSVNIFTVFPII